MHKDYSRNARIFVTTCLLSVVLAATAIAQSPNQSVYPITWQFNVKVPMKDGVKLATDILRPDSSERFPAILIRTPYGKGDEPSRDETTYLAQHGYAVVVQDVRGRNDSEGEWVPYFHEADDGYDAIQWTAEQSWCNGMVVNYGASYVSMVQWLAATRQNPHLKGMVSVVGPSDLYESKHPGGSFLQGGSLSWSTIVDGRVDQYQEIGFSPWLKAFRHLPVSEGLQAVGRDVQFYRDWVSHPEDDSYWQKLRWRSFYNTFDFPVLNVGGWFDVYQKGTIENFQKMRTLGPARVRGSQRLIVGPWVHRSAATLQPDQRQGDVDFGPDSVLNLREIILRWLDHYIKGIDNGIDKEPPARIFTMGENIWHSYADWPVAGTQYIDYYLQSNGSANTLNGDGILSTTAPSSQGRADRYVYDPDNPVPTVGGNLCCSPDILPWGPMDQRAVERRDDVLVYTTAPLSEDLRVTGPLKVKLWAATSAHDTDFTVKLTDVYPNGFVMNVADGILRARYRNSLEKGELLEAGKPYELMVDLWNTSNLFKKSHRIRVEVSSSNFPHYSRNMNLAGQPETQTTWELAQQSVFHDADHPSRIILPVLKP